MKSFIFKRILSAIPLILIITVLAFSLIQLAPYDAIDSIILPSMSPSQIEALKASHGLDKPVALQYFYWLKNVFTLNLGNSIVTNNSIGQSLATRLPNTLLLVIPAFIISFIITVVLGLLAGANKGKRIDRFIDSMTTIGIAIPN
ncbi:MAG: ABC transporter permease, partial [Bacilli bacterium]